MNMRRKLLVQRFVMALTSGQSSVRPIEMQAHDPVRCVHEGTPTVCGVDVRLKYGSNKQVARMPQAEDLCQELPPRWYLLLHAPGRAPLLLEHTDHVFGPDRGACPRRGCFVQRAVWRNKTNLCRKTSHPDSLVATFELCYVRALP